MLIRFVRAQIQYFKISNFTRRDYIFRWEIKYYSFFI